MQLDLARPHPLLLLPSMAARNLGSQLQLNQGKLLLRALPPHFQAPSQLAVLSALHSTHTLPSLQQPITPNLRQLLLLENVWSGKHRAEHN